MRTAAWAGLAGRSALSPALEVRLILFGRGASRQPTKANMIRIAITAEDRNTSRSAFDKGNQGQCPKGPFEKYLRRGFVSKPASD